MAPNCPTHNFTRTLIGLSPFESHRVKEFFLSGDHLVEVFVRIPCCGPVMTAVLSFDI